MSAYRSFFVLRSPALLCIRRQLPHEMSCVIPGSFSHMSVRTFAATPPPPSSSNSDAARSTVHFPAGSTDAPTVPKNSREKLKAAIRDYGSTVLLFHIGSGVTFLGMWYLVVSSGVDVTSVIKTLGLEGTVGKLAGGAGTFVVAYAIHKATAPLRIGLTLTVTPLIVNYLRRKGLMKIKS